MLECKIHLTEPVFGVRRALIRVISGARARARARLRVNVRVGVRRPFTTQNLPNGFKASKSSSPMRLVSTQKYIR